MQRGRRVVLELDGELGQQLLQPELVGGAVGAAAAPEAMVASRGAASPPVRSSRPARTALAARGCGHRQVRPGSRPLEGQAYDPPMARDCDGPLETPRDRVAVVPLSALRRLPST